jgi:hypothetical protein
MFCRGVQCGTSSRGSQVCVPSSGQRTGGVSSLTQRAVLAGMKRSVAQMSRWAIGRGQMNVALGVQSRRQFVRYGPGAAARAAVVVDAEPADAAAQWAVRGPVRSGRRSPDPRCCYSTANAVGAGSFTWRGRHSPCCAGLGRW